MALVLWPSVSRAQIASDIDRAAGLQPNAAASFFRQLRAAVGTSDKSRACALIVYPLQHADGTLNDAAACEARYDSIFTIDVRKAIGKQSFDDLFANERGVMIGMGEVWFAGGCATPPCGAGDVRIIAVNSRSEGLVPPKGKRLLACRAAGQLIHVVADGANGAEMHIWRSGRADDVPELKVPKAVDAQRDGTCGAREWTFADGTTRYTIGDLSCSASDAPPPMGSVGELVVRRDGQADVRVWCEE